MNAWFNLSARTIEYAFAPFSVALLFICPYIGKSNPRPDAFFKSGPYLISVFHDTTLFTLVPVEMMTVEHVSKESKKLVERWMWTTPAFAASITDDTSNDKMEDLIYDSLLKEDAFRIWDAHRDTIVFFDSTISYVDSNGDSVNGYMRALGDSMCIKIIRAINGTKDTVAALEKLLGVRDSSTAFAIVAKEQLNFSSFLQYGPFRIYSQGVRHDDHDDYSSSVVIKHGDYSLMYKAWSPDLESNGKLEKAIDKAFKLMDDHHSDPEGAWSQSADPPLQR